MSMLTMCHGTRCDRREKCRRYTDPISPIGWQSWFEPAIQGLGCENYIHNGFVEGKDDRAQDQ